MVTDIPISICKRLGFFVYVDFEDKEDVVSATLRKKQTIWIEIQVIKTR